MPVNNGNKALQYSLLVALWLGQVVFHLHLSGHLYNIHSSPSASVNACMNHHHENVVSIYTDFESHCTVFHSNWYFNFLLSKLTYMGGNLKCLDVSFTVFAVYAYAKLMLHKRKNASGKGDNWQGVDRD